MDTICHPNWDTSERGKDAIYNYAGSKTSKGKISDEVGYVVNHQQKGIGETHKTISGELGRRLSKV